MNINGSLTVGTRFSSRLSIIIERPYHRYPLRHICTAASYVNIRIIFPLELTSGAITPHEYLSVQEISSLIKPHPTKLSSTRPRWIQVSVSRAANVSRARQLHQSSETVLLELTEIPLEKTERRNQLARSRLEIGTIVANWQQDTFKGPSAAWRALLARARARAETFFRHESTDISLSSNRIVLINNTVYGC